LQVSGVPDSIEDLAKISRLSVYARCGAADPGFNSGIGREVNGSRRWLSLFVFNLQPSELMKLIVVLYAADYTCAKAS